MIATGLVTFLAASAPASACTGIRLKAADGGVVTGRTLEFGFFIPTDIVAIPRGQAFASKTTIGPGVAWASKYATVGAALQGTDYLIDGINEKGLAVGLFYFPTFASYTQTTRDNQARSVAIVDFGTWLLTMRPSPSPHLLWWLPKAVPNSSNRLARGRIILAARG
jgi:choloylglycine hydrolase